MKANIFPLYFCANLATTLQTYVNCSRIDTKMSNRSNLLAILTLTALFNIQIVTHHWHQVMEQLSLYHLAGIHMVQMPLSHVMLVSLYLEPILLHVKLMECGVNQLYVL